MQVGYDKKSNMFFITGLSFAEAAKLDTLLRFSRFSIADLPPDSPSDAGIDKEYLKFIKTLLISLDKAMMLSESIKSDDP